MARDFEVGDSILFMKVGTHANEPLEEIIRRKQLEIEQAGLSMWGYGGSTCHPRTMVQPFAERSAKVGKTIRLVMHPMESHHFADKVRAEQSSADRFSWEPIPPAINVLGSRFALCIANLQEVQWDLPLDDTRVAIGNSTGKRGSDYLQGRVDKACLEVTETSSGTTAASKIELVAELVAPYAVFLK
jgi:hypothetical protein